jgi:hypothetical protein
MRKINLLVLLLLSTVTSIFAANQTYNWIQMTQYITYAANGTEASRTEYTYDTEGRETGYKYFSNGTLSQQYRDYQYNGRTITCWGDTYTAGSVSSSGKIQRTYSDLNWIQLTQQIQYATNGTELSRMEYTYDTEGRETGYKYFLNGTTLYSQFRDYQNNGRTITCWYDMYIGGSIVSGKIQRTYSDLNWIQITQQIQYDANGTESNRMEYTYDTEGRETGYKSFGIGPVSYQYRDYQYNGQTIICWFDMYTSGSVNSSFKIERTYREAETKTTGLADKNQLTFSIYPNPTQGVFNIAGLPTGTYKILNLMGAEVFQFNVESTDAQLLNLSHLAKGLYQISSDDLKIMHNKVVITD